ncbi:MAG: hypothetical protein ACI8QT_002070 [Halioglobus sp.]|jgi:hypothetical protein
MRFDGDSGGSIKLTLLAIIMIAVYTVEKNN